MVEHDSAHSDHSPEEDDSIPFARKLGRWFGSHVRETMDHPKREIATAAESLILLSPFLQFAYYAATAPNPASEDLGYGPEAKFRLTKGVHKNKYGGTLTNMGVYHTHNSGVVVEKDLIEAIDQCDILCLEGAKHGKFGGGFFARLRDYGFTQNKRVFDVDVLRHSRILIGQTLVTIPVAGICSGSIICDHFKKRTEDGYSIIGSTRRNFLRALGGVSLASWSFHGLDFGATVRNAEEANGFVNDGRTQDMTAESLEIQEENRRKHVLLVSGEGHAAAVEHYLEHSDELEHGLENEYQLMRAIYGAPAKEVFPIKGIFPSDLDLAIPSEDK